MNLRPILDMGWAPIAALFGVQVLIFAAPLTVFGEAGVIWRFLPPLKEYSFWRSVKASAIMNVISGILGYIVFSVISGPGIISEDFFGATYYESTLEAVLALYSGMMGSLCIISIVVEGFVLGFLESKSPRKSIWLIAVLSNLVSYLGLFAITILIYISL